jgi:hypothetical protein
MRPISGPACLPSADGADRHARTEDTLSLSKTEASVNFKRRAGGAGAPRIAKPDAHV